MDEKLMRTAIIDAQPLQTDSERDKNKNESQRDDGLDSMIATFLDNKTRLAFLRGGVRRDGNIPGRRIVGRNFVPLAAGRRLAKSAIGASIKSRG